MADTVNNLVITEGTPNGLAGNPFNQTTVIVATADRGIDQRIRAAALSAGYSGDIFNTQVFPSAMLNMGSENNSNTFAIILRPALYKDKQAGNDYLNNTPAVILRVTPNESTKLDPYSYPELRVRGTDKTEFDLMDDLEELRMAILKKYSGLNAIELPTSQIVPMGSDAIQRGIDALIPDNDAGYLWTGNQTISSQTPPFPNLSQYYSFVRHPAITLGNDTNEFMIVYGINHVATERRYIRISVPTERTYGMELEQSPTQISMELPRNISPTILMRNTFMSIRSPEIATAIHTALRFPMVREATAYIRISRFSSSGGTIWKRLQKLGQPTQRSSMIRL